MKLEELLSLKDFKYRAVVTIEPNEDIMVAVNKLNEYDRGSLPVCNQSGEVVGIITERDIVRKCLNYGGDLLRLKVSDIMSREVVIATPDDDLDYAISVMKQKRIRHLPVLVGNKIAGMISMRDLLGVQLEEYKSQARMLSDYIAGPYP